MLIDAYRGVGRDGLAQAELGVRENRHQPLGELSAMAYQVLVAAQRRIHGPDAIDRLGPGTLLQPAHGTLEPRALAIDERPPLASLRPGAADPAAGDAGRRGTPGGGQTPGGEEGRGAGAGRGRAAGRRLGRGDAGGRGGRVAYSSRWCSRQPIASAFGAHRARRSLVDRISPHPIDRLS